jgi:RecA-family ATPase
MASHKPEEYDYVLPGILSKTIASIVGSGGIGKSFLALEFCAYIASAGTANLMQLPLLKTKTYLENKHKCRYLNAEDPEIVLHHRFHDMMEYFDKNTSELIFTNMSICSLYQENPILLDGKGNLNLEWIEILQDYCADVDIVILDTLSRFNYANESSDDLMKQLMGILDKISKDCNTTIIYVHHNSKASQLQGYAETQAASRGSNVLTYNARGTYNLVGMSKKEAESISEKYNIDIDRKKYAKLCNSKINYGENEDEIWLYRNPGGILVRAVWDKKEDETICDPDNTTSNDAITDWI